MKKLFLLPIVFLMSIAQSIAQPEFDGDLEDAPISGAWILVAAAIIFGMYKMYKLRKQEKQFSC